MLTISSSVVLSFYLGALAYGYFIEPEWVELTKTEIRVPRPVLGFQRFRLVHLSDLHLQRFGDRESRIIDMVSRANPHLVLITGDYTDSASNMPALIEMLRKITAPYGVYGVRGNNDDKVGSLEQIQNAGVALLQDEKRVISTNDCTLCLVGLKVIPTIHLGDLLRDLDPSATTILMHHMPEGLDEMKFLASRQRVDLFLCGHTHGGQVCLPFWGAILTESKYHKKYERGLYTANGVPVYVNRGIGTTAIPIRFLSRPEVAVIDLVNR